MICSRTVRRFQNLGGGGSLACGPGDAGGRLCVLACCCGGHAKRADARIVCAFGGSVPLAVVFVCLPLMACVRACLRVSEAKRFLSWHSAQRRPPTSVFVGMYSFLTMLHYFGCRNQCQQRVLDRSLPRPFGSEFSSGSTYF